jgi:ring-1,2-phenylacetyl-CoA epoxidase subunit PaaA
MSEQEFLEYVQSGGQVETADELPDDYRAKLIKFIEMHGNSELMGVLPEREWILRAPTLQRKLALTAKVQDEVGHSQLIYRVVRISASRASSASTTSSRAGRSSTTSSTTRRRRGATSA